MNQDRRGFWDDRLEPDRSTFEVEKLAGYRLAAVKLALVQRVVRPYVARDASAVVDLSLRAWEPDFASLEAVLGEAIFQRLHRDWRANQRGAVEDVLADENLAVWVAEDDGYVAGFVAVKLHRSTSVGEIYMLAVDPTLQNTGIGTDLTRLALDRISEAGMTTAMVDSGGDPGHAPARRTYEKAGFTLLPIARYFKAL